jgi:hypothetical protein
MIMLTREEAQQLVLARLGKRHDQENISVAEDRTIERAFGWVFFLVMPQSGAPDDSDAQFQRSIIVNKHVGQVVASSIAYPPERLIEIYEGLLAMSQAMGGDWCSTLSYPIPWSSFRLRRLQKKTKEAGFYEIR